MKRVFVLVMGSFLTVAAAAGAQTAGASADAAPIPNPLKAATPAVASAAVSENATAQACIPVKHARELVGKSGCVAGKVVKVGESRGGNIYVNFCTNYRKCEFSAIALKRESAYVGDLRELEGKVVELRGGVTEYQGNPEMMLKRRDQITVTGEFKNKPEQPYEATNFRIGGPGRTHHSSFKPRYQRTH